jgi:hypothetical protein
MRPYRAKEKAKVELGEIATALDISQASSPTFFQPGDIKSNFLELGPQIQHTHPLWNPHSFHHDVPEQQY